MSSKVHYSLPDRALIPVSGTLIATFPIGRVKVSRYLQPITFSDTQSLLVLIYNPW